MTIPIMNTSNNCVLEMICAYCKQFILKKTTQLSKKHHTISQPLLIHLIDYPKFNRVKDFIKNEDLAGNVQLDDIKKKLWI